MSDRERRLVVRRACDSKQRASDLKNRCNLKVGVRRVQQILHDVPHLKYKRMTTGPRINAQHRVERVSWANDKLDWNGPNWRNVIFSDEKKFNLHGPDGLACYWHNLRKDPETFSKRQQGGKSVMIWAAISYFDTSDLVLLEGNQDSRDYCSVLQTILLPFASASNGTNWLLQHDNASHSHLKLHEKLAFEQRCFSYGLAGEVSRP